MKTCSRGHKYDEGLDSCPYCPRPTCVGGTEASAEGAYIDPDRTVIDEMTDDYDTGGNSGAGRNPRLDKTMVLDPLQKEVPVTGQQQRRKLVGFLVTFTWNQHGEYFELFAGRTTIGSTHGSADIKVDDILVSETHSQLVFRNGLLRVKDAFSTNGTWVNEKDIGDTAHPLADRDILRIGKTEFQVILVEV